MRPFLTSICVIAAAAFVPCLATAKPIVAVALSGSFVISNADGKETFVPVTSRNAMPGERIRWEIIVKNTGDSAARNLVPSGRIAAPTSYISSSASGEAANIEFSTDGAKSWSTAPTITVDTPAGPKIVKASVASYTAIRWLRGGALAPGASRRYSYDVVVR